MVTESGLYHVTVDAENNPTYLRGGLYHVELRGEEMVRFTSETGSQTYECLEMLEIFERQAPVLITSATIPEKRIVECWYRGSLNIDPLQGNGKQTDLENDIREFEQWACSEGGA